MAVLKLTSALISSLGDEPAELWDAVQVGLCLRVRSSREKATWSFRYRPKSGEGNQRVTLGKLKDLSLADARVKANALRTSVNEGNDPSKVKRTTRAAARSAMRFDALAQSYLENYAKLHKASWRQDELLLKRPREAWKTRRPEELTRADVATLLQEIALTAPVSANRTRTVLVKLFNWSTDSGFIKANPIAGMKKIAKETSKERVLTDSEIGVFWRALATADNVTQDVGDALRLVLLSGQRPGEIVGIEQIELVDIDDANEARVEIPSGRMKSRRPHIVPLAPMARAIVQAAIKRRASEGEEVALLASRYFDRTSLARHSLSHAMRRLIPALTLDDGISPEDAKAIASLKGSPPSPHDLRRSVASGLSRLGVDGDTRRLLLAHAATDIHGRVYDRHQRLPERRLALEKWEAHLASVLDRGEPAEPAKAADNVVALARKRRVAK